MALLINAVSFVKTGVVSFLPEYDEGTVELTLRGETRRVEARRSPEGDIIAFGLVGKYQTSEKLWPASLRQHALRGEVVESANFGRDDRCGKFTKINCILFKP